MHLRQVRKKASPCGWRTVFDNLGSRRGAGGHGHTRGSGGQGIVRVGNFRYVENELRLGSLEGNRFDIALRNVQLEVGVDPEQCLERAAKALQDYGFINYFGVQRFGKFYDTHETGFCVLKGDYLGAVETILRPKRGERENITAAREAWRDRFQGVTNEEEKAKVERECADKVLREFGRFMQSENAVLQSLSRFPLQYKKAFGCIGKTQLSPFLVPGSSLGSPWFSEVPLSSKDAE